MMYNQDMDMTELYTEINNDRFPRLVVLTGEEEFPIYSVISLAKKKIGMDVVEFKESFTSDALRTAFSTVPMFGDKRLVVINKTGFFRWNKNSDVYDLFESIPDHVVCIVYEDDVNRTTTNYKRIAKAGIAIVSEKLPPTRIRTWISNQYSRKSSFYGLKSRPSKDVIEKLAGLYSNHSMQEIDQCLAYLVSLEREVFVSDVTDYFGIHEELPFYKLYDALTDGGIVAVVADMMATGEAPLKLLSIVGGVFRNLRKFQSDGGRSDGLSQYMHRILRKMTSQFSERDVRTIVSYFIEIDAMIKTTSAPDVDLILLYAMRIDGFRKKQNSTKEGFQ